MSTKFTQRHVGSEQTIGERLAEARKAKKLTIARVESRLKIQSAYLEAFEADRFDDLPEVYLRGFLTRYAELLGLDPKEILKPLLTERRIKQVSSSRPTRSRTLRDRHIVTPRRLAWLGLVMVTAISLPLLGRGFAVWAEEPVVIFDPVFIDERTGEATLKGRIDPESRLWAEGLEVPVRDNGEFSLHVLLPSGPNRVDFEVKSRFGKRATTSKVISVFPPQPVSSTDPVALRVEIVDRPAWITVRTGSRKLFEGLMVVGAAQTFYGPELTLSTKDAGATLASVSNTRVQRHDLGRLGRAGETKENLRIMPDTEIR